MILLLHITGLTEVILLSSFVHETVEIFKPLRLQTMFYPFAISIRPRILS